jgi:cell wall-associated NlpC family hydrolase
MNSSRRIFLRRAGVLAGLALLGRRVTAKVQERPGNEDPSSIDRQIFKTKTSLAEENHLRQQPVGDAVAAIGRSFIGTPYVAHTLEEPGEEHLVINLRGLDCTTFMENSLVLARCVKKGRTSFDDYRRELQFVRYRDGKISGYPSRLHYFTDWVFNNDQKKVLRDITAELGGKPAGKRVNYMSTHTGSYPQLSRDENVRALLTIEESMHRRGFAVVLKDRIPGILSQLRNGDIIGTATTMDGMDVSHTGIVVREKGTARFLHAPLSGGAVCLADGSLADYLAAHKSMTGIVVARPLDP